MKAQVKVLQLTPLAKARVWFDSGTHAFVPAGMISRQFEGDPIASARTGHVTLEAFVPRGGRAEYGLLGISFERDSGNSLQIRVPYSAGEGVPWLDSLGTQVDHVRLGLPQEYAQPIFNAIELSAHRFPPGTIQVVDAAHGLVGSSGECFQRLATGALSLILNGRQRKDDELIAYLKRLLLR